MKYVSVISDRPIGVCFKLGYLLAYLWMLYQIWRLLICIFMILYDFCLLFT